MAANAGRRHRCLRPDGGESNLSLPSPRRNLGGIPGATKNARVTGRHRFPGGQSVADTDAAAARGDADKQARLSKINLAS